LGDKIKAYKESLYGRDANVMRYTEKDIAASFTAADFTTEPQLKGTSFFDERSLYCPFERYCSNYTAFYIKLPFLELDYTASAKCRSRHLAPLNG
jgi:hypothetical protein